MKKSQPEPGDSDLNILVVPGRVFDEEKKADYRKMREDIEKGLITPVELRQKNCVHRSDDCELDPGTRGNPCSLK